MAAPIEYDAFHSPVQLGIFSLAVGQTDKLIPFKSLAGVFIAGTKVDFYLNKRLLKSYTIGDGITISGTNLTANIKTAELLIQGSDFSTCVDETLLGRCTFFDAGDVEIEFNLKIYK